MEEGRGSPRLDLVEGRTSYRPRLRPRRRVTAPSFTDRRATTDSADITFCRVSVAVGGHRVGVPANTRPDRSAVTSSTKGSARYRLNRPKRRARREDTRENRDYREYPGAGPPSEGHSRKANALVGRLPLESRKDRPSSAGRSFPLACYVALVSGRRARRYPPRWSDRRTRCQTSAPSWIRQERAGHERRLD